MRCISKTIVQLEGIEDTCSENVTKKPQRDYFDTVQKQYTAVIKDFQSQKRIFSVWSLSTDHSLHITMHGPHLLPPIVGNEAKILL